MPELPEVEATARELRGWTRGRRLLRVRVTAGRQTRGMAARTFARLLEGRAVQDVTRRGKWMLVRLSGDAGLALHLGMTGDLVRAEDGVEPPYSRASLRLDRGGTVHFVDPRRFGRLVASACYQDLLAMPGVGGLGPDALEVTPARLREALRTSRAIKTALLDQGALAGLGNIYATDALFRARLHPLTPASLVAADAALTRRLAAAIREVLKRGMARWDRSERPERDGEALYPGSVYGLGGRPCPRCGGPLESRSIGARATVFCPRCQPPSRGR